MRTAGSVKSIVVAVIVVAVAALAPTAAGAWTNPIQDRYARFLELGKT